MLDVMSHFVCEGRRIAYSDRGEGARAVVLIHGLLFDRRLVERLAGELAGRGFRAITIDLLGHGESDRPTEVQAYSMGAYARQVVGLLDHLELDEAVVGGMSLGANTALEVAALAPERVRGMIVEMPVLDHALIAAAVAFTPLMVVLTFGAPVMKGVQAVAKALPAGRLGWFADRLAGLVRQDPEPGGALLQGLFFARIAPPREVRRTFAMPTLVIGHRRDPVHPFSDSGALVQELPDARLVEATSIVELLLSPERLTGEITTFLDACWAPRRRSRARAA